MARKRSYTHIDEEVTINLTPLIDVVFVVLIMFILIAPILELDRIELARAKEQTVKEAVLAKENSPLILHVHADNTIWFNNKKITLQQLPQLMNQAKKQNPKQIPQLYHDKKAYFGTYQSVKNIVEEAGFEQMDEILKPK